MKEEYEYSGSPKKVYVKNLIFSILVAVLMYWFTAHLYNQFDVLEKGNTIMISNLLYNTYTMVGKWPILIFFGVLGFSFLYLGYSYFKKYQQVKHNDF